jgi:hypothetical protein
MSEEMKNLNNEPEQAPVEKKPLSKKQIGIIAGIGAAVVVLIVVLAIVLGGGSKNPAPTPDPTPNPGPAVTEEEFKLGLGVVVSLDSSKTGTAQVDGTIATVVLDKDGKIVLCRLDAIQNKVSIADGFVELPDSFKTKMELGDDYNMAKYGQNQDRNGDGIVKEWYDQAKAFENYVVGMTAAQVKAIATQTQADGYVIPADEALLNAGCTILITDFIDAVAKACEDEQGVSFKTAGTFTLGIAANSYDEGSVDADAEDGTIKVYSDIAASVIENGKILASLNDAIQPTVSFDIAGEITAKNFKGTKRELKEDYGMGGKPYSPDRNGDGIVKEWYEQSAAFSAHVVGMTLDQVKSMPTQTQDDGYVIPADEALLGAGCTIQITAIIDVVAESVTNAR